MKKVIGFNVSDEEQEPAEAPKPTLLQQYFEHNYAPTGEMEQKEFRTSLELKHELSEVMIASMYEMNELLTLMGYETRFIEGVPHWVMYQISL